MKIGITTYFYKTYNYGANLQAYALCKQLNLIGLIAEQIRFLPTAGCKFVKIPIRKRFIYGLKALVYSVIKFIQHPINHIKYKRLYNIRCKAVDNFCLQYIPHSKKIYTAKSIKNSLNIYTCYITGSDVVWLPKQSSSILFLRFVPTSMKKISYAASLGTDSLTAEEKAQLKKDLMGFDAISVREKSAVKLLENLTDVNVVQCLDSTLLLSKKDWEYITSERIIPKDYLFCYFLGNNTRARELAIDFARRRGLQVVNIAYYCDKYKRIDDFGDIKLYDISPSGFLSLIKFAKFIFTDSFHACVFSQMFEKNFYAFKRNVSDPASIRLVDFLGNTHTEERFMDSPEKESSKYINNLGDIDYSISGIGEINDKIEISKQFLKNNLQQFVCNA